MFWNVTARLLSRHQSIIFFFSISTETKLFFRFNRNDRGFIVVYKTVRLLNGAVFITSGGTLQNEDISNHWRHPVDLLTLTFDTVALLYKTPVELFYRLIKAYADLYNIDLHLVAYVNKKYTIIDRNNIVELNEGQLIRDKHAFLLCNTENSYYWPLSVLFTKGISFFSTFL
jgi:hypothetical protein